MTDADRGQIATTAAEVYEDFFIPALFGQWPPRLLDAADVGAGHSVLDVGCGTGVLARAAARRVGDGGRTVGIDPNVGMLAVAERAPERVEWTTGVVEDLPFDNGEFNRVMSQFVMMFVEDRQRALSEMARVLQPEGRVAIATWSSLPRTPGYEAMVGLLGDLFGEEAANALTAPFVMGDADELAALLATEFREVNVVEHEGVARFDSIEAWVHTDIKGWTLSEMIDDDQYRLLLERARDELARFTDQSGEVRFAAPALIATGTPR